MKFVFLGDIHGNLNHALNVCNQYKDDTVVAIGDVGVGFIPIDVFYRLPANFKFFVGNHDKRELAKTLPHCLGDYGVYEDKFFFVSGADSIDKDTRIEGVSWWPDEELTHQQCYACMDLWEKSKVDVLASHDCPQSFAEAYKLIYDKSRTRNLLQSMIEIRKPKMIIHGHHHRKLRHMFQGIQVIELFIDECYELDIP